MKTNAKRDQRTLTGLLALALAGCGGVSGIPIDETSTRIADTVCPKAWMCCTADQLSGNSAAGTDVASCETATKQNYQNILATLQGSVDQHRAAYQSAQVDACLATIMNSDCATLNMTTHLEGVPGCESFTTPLVAMGQACSQSYECIDGWCNVPESSTNGEGVCEGFVPFGESCRLGGGPSCGPNAVCDPEGTIDDSSDDLCEPVSPNARASRRPAARFGYAGAMPDPADRDGQSQPAPAPPACAVDPDTECPVCAARGRRVKMQPVKAHYQCPECRYFDSCCM